MLKKLLLFLGIIVLVGGLYFLSIMRETGFFRELDELPFGDVYQEIPVIGAEDFTIDYKTGLMFISAFDRAGAVRDENPTGALYIMDLNQEPFEPRKLPNLLGDGFHPHGIHVRKLDSAYYQLLVVNHQNDGHTIERFELRGNDFSHAQTYSDNLILSPNDVVASDHGQFFFTNDHGKKTKLGILAENYLGLPASNVVLFDGASFQIVADGIQYANGINIDLDRQKLYVAAPRSFEIKVYDVAEDMSLTHSEDIETETGVDNLEWDESGALWSGAHPNLLRFSAYAKLNKTTAPSEVIKLENGEIEKVFINDGSLFSASSVALPYKDYLFIGTVMDDKILVLKK